jgi:hypothetical protein
VISHDEVLERMAHANPLPDVDMITDGQIAELTLDIERARHGTADGSSAPSRVSTDLYRLSAVAPDRRQHSRWLRPAVAFGLACLTVLAVVGIAALTAGEELDVADRPDVPVTALPEGVAPPTPDLVNRVRSLVATEDGSLWATTRRGIVRWDVATRTPTVYTSDDGLPDDSATFIAAGRAGTVWVGSERWLAHFDGTWTIVHLPDDLSSAVSLAIAPDGTPWLVFENGELGHYDGSSWQRVPSPSVVSDRVWVTSLAVAPDETVWVGLSTADARVDDSDPVQHPAAGSFTDGEWTMYTTADGIPEAFGHAVAVATDGTVWVGSFGVTTTDGTADDTQTIPGGGVARFDGATWTRYTSIDGLPSNDSVITIGADASVWAVGINGEGVARFDGTRWETRSNVTGGFPTIDADGSLWAESDDAEGGIIGFDGSATIRLQVPSDGSTTATPTTEVLPPREDWNPILAQTRAGSAVPAATCPDGADPARRGPVDQDRPADGWIGIQAAAFDHRTGRILTVDDWRETWAFDVCTNTWQRLGSMGAVPGELPAGLVYDVDSDVTVAFRSHGVTVFDARSNEWTPRAGGFPGSAFPLGAVYDPVSGLILTTFGAEDPERLDLWAYDVDTDEYTEVGLLWASGDDDPLYELLGYAPELDRLIFGSLSERTALVDPRTGETTLIETRTPGISFVWPKAQYGPAGDSVYVAVGTVVDGGAFTSQFPGQICGFDVSTSTWTTCFPLPGAGGYAAFHAMVGDPINNRLVLISGLYGNFWVNADDGVWAIDLDTGATSELVSPSR